MSDLARFFIGAAIGLVITAAPLLAGYLFWRRLVRSTYEVQFDARRS